MKTTFNEQVRFKTLRDLFEIFLLEIAENLMLFKETLSDLRKEVSSRKLDFLIGDIASDNGRQISDLGIYLDKFSISWDRQKNTSMKYLSNECATTLKKMKESPVRDAYSIAILQKVFHLQLSEFRTIIIMSEELGENKTKKMFENLHHEAEKNDRLLSESAYNTINFDAAMDENKKILREHYNPKT